MSDSTYSFVYEEKSASAAFPGIATQPLVLSLLAGIPPEPVFSGCLVFEGASPLGPGTACVVTSGPGADAVQLRLLEALERVGITVLEVYEGGPAQQTPIAQARDGVWSSPAG